MNNPNSCMVIVSNHHHRMVVRNEIIQLNTSALTPLSTSIAGWMEASMSLLEMCGKLDVE